MVLISTALLVPVVASAAHEANAAVANPTQNGSVNGDYDGDGKTDFTVFRPSTGWWYTISSRDGSRKQLGQNSYGVNGAGYPFATGSNIYPAPANYTADRATDFGIIRRNATSTDFRWAATTVQGNGVTSIAYCTACFAAQSNPVPADYNGDGKADIAVWDSATGVWTIDYTVGPFVTRQWGQTGDIPVPGDYDGDGKADLGVFRPSTGYWYVQTLTGVTIVNQQWGDPTDIPVPGDYNRDGKTDIVVWRPSNHTWYGIDNTRHYVVLEGLGASGDVPTPGDYNGDGYTDLATWRPSDGTWRWKPKTGVAGSPPESAPIQWGQTGDVPVS